MYNSDTDLLFPTRIIPELGNFRGPDWKELIETVLKKDEKNKDILALVLLMVKINGCITCNSDSFRAMRGCTMCATQNIKRFKGDDKELISLFIKNKVEIEKYLSSRNDNKEI